MTRKSSPAKWITLASGLALLTAVNCGDDNKPGTANPGTGGARTGGSSGTGGARTGGSTGTGGASSGSGGASGNLDANGDTSETGDASETGGDGSADATETGGPDIVQPGDAGSASAMMSFFVTSETTDTPNLGGLAMADAKCQRLGTAAGSTKTWKAYLSTSTENARTRIGNGPWYNFKGVLIASDLEQLHEESGKKNMINQDNGLTDKGLIVSGKDVRLAGEANQHDILTGSLANGMVAGEFHCNNWTSTTGMKQVGHLDRTGTNPDPIKNVSWNASHTSTCADTKTAGGAGRFYCFATN
jgi:hypothetical protein